MLTRFAFSLLTISALIAQDPRGRITGRVTDPTGAVVPNTEISATNRDTGVKLTATTNETGAYDLLYIQPGIYDVNATANGFKVFNRPSVEVNVASRLSVDIVLQVGNITESVTVSSQTSQLETSTASIGRVVDSKRILDLPLPGGNALSLSRLAPGIVSLAAANHPSLGPATEVLSSLSANGVRGGNIEFSVDGTPAMWGTNAAYAPPADLIAEFKVQTTSYDASIGRAPGGNVNVVLRSGTNKMHSTLYFFHNNQHIQGLDLFQRQTLYNAATGPVTDQKIKTTNPLNVLNRFGATFSGPVLLPKLYDGRNKTFWIYSFEGLTRPGVERGTPFYTVPTVAERGGDFSALLPLGATYLLYDPNTTTAAANGRFQRLPLAGNIVPASRLDKTALELLSYWPLPNYQGTADGRQNFQFLQTSWNYYKSHSAKVDHNFNEKHRMFGRYNQWYNQFTSGRLFPNDALGNDRYRKNYGAVVDDIYVITPSLLNDFRIGFNRLEQSFYPLSQGFDLAKIGFAPQLVSAISADARTFPNINIAGYQPLGTANFSRSFSNYGTLTNDLSWNRGNHSVKFGGEFRVYRENSYDYSNLVPQETFNNRWTGGPMDNSPAAPIGQGLASFLLGLPSGGQISANGSVAQQSKSTAFYVQDDWRVRRNLTLNIGLRYDFDSPLTERYNRSVRGFDFTRANPIASAAIANYAKSPLPELPASQFAVNGGLTFAGSNGLPRQLWQMDRNNFSPRLGLAWTAMKDTVVRAGYGIFFVPLGSDRAAVLQNGYSVTTTLNPSNDNGLTYISSLANPFPGGWAQPPGASQGLSTDVGRGVAFFREQSVNPYMQRWSFGFQRQLPKDYFLDVSYIGNRGTKLAVNRDYNALPNRYLSTSATRDADTINFLSSQVSNPFYPVLPGTNLSGTTVARSQLLRAYPEFTSVTRSEPQGYSWYHSLQTVAEHRFRSGYTFQFNYTWSKFMEAITRLNGGDPVPEKVISDLDRTHRVALSGIYELPFGAGKRWSTPNPVVNQLAAGWQLQVVWQANSGAAIGFGNSILVQPITSVPLASSERTLDRWFNTAAFNRSPAEQLASNVRTMSTRFSGVRAPGLDVWDLSAVKTFTITERVRLQFRAEALNALNHTNLVAPVTDPTNTLFGKISGVNGFPRYIHLGLKLLF